MERKTAMMIVMAALVVLTAAAAAAQEGLFLGANIPLNRLSGDLSGLESGNGFGVHGGYGVNRYLSFVADAFSTKHALKNGDGNIYLNGFTVDAKVNVPVTGSVIEPYVRGGVGQYSLDHRGTMTRGEGRQAGVGIDIALFPALRFYVGLTNRRIHFDTVPMTKGSVSSLEYGITVYFL